MNAYRNALCAGAPKGMEPHPFTTRKQLIEVIHSRHKIQNDSFEKHMNTVISEFAEKRYVAASVLKIKEERDRQAHLKAIAEAADNLKMASSDAYANITLSEKETKERSEPTL